jgi:hypothetical protein
MIFIIGFPWVFTYHSTYSTYSNYSPNILLMLPVYFIHFGELPLDLQKVIISIADPHPTILSLVSKFFNEWAIPLKVTFYSNGK